jgi:hypothetical protein
MTKLLNILIIVLTLGLVAVILLPQIQENRPRELRFVCDSSVSALPFLVGVDDSIFVKNRIIPELSFYSDPEDGLERLFAGEYDVGIFPWTTVLKHIAEGGETLMVFMDQEFRATLAVDAIVVPAESKVDEIGKLSRMRLAYPPQLRDCIKPFLINTNIVEENITLIEKPLPELIPALRADEADAAWLLEPELCTIDTAEFRILQAAALPKYVSAPFPGAAIGFAPGMLDESKVLLSRLKIGTDATLATIENDAALALEVVARYFPQTRDRNCRLPEVHRLVGINRPAVSALSDRLKVAGVLENEVATGNLFVQPAKLTR